MVIIAFYLLLSLLTLAIQSLIQNIPGVYKLFQQNKRVDSTHKEKQFLYRSDIQSNVQGVTFQAASGFLVGMRSKRWNYCNNIFNTMLSLKCDDIST